MISRRPGPASKLLSPADVTMLRKHCLLLGFGLRPGAPALVLVHGCRAFEAIVLGVGRRMVHAEFRVRSGAHKQPRVPILNVFVPDALQRLADLRRLAPTCVGAPLAVPTPTTESPAPDQGGVPTPEAR